MPAPSMALWPRLTHPLPIYINRVFLTNDGYFRIGSSVKMMLALTAPNTRVQNKLSRIATFPVSMCICRYNTVVGKSSPMQVASFN